MLITITLAAALPFVAAQTCATTTTPLPASATPSSPANDPFWNPPSGFLTDSSKKPGTVFNCRQVKWNGVDGAQAYYQYAYKTSLYSKANQVAVATLLIPSKWNGAKFSQLVSYQVPYDSPTPYCGPSYVNQPNSGVNTTNTYGIGYGAGDSAPSTALKAGYPVVISDYETKTAGFVVGASSGYGTLDGIRAVISQTNFFNANPKVALWGYSGGSLATNFAAENKASYANELNIVGAALGGLVPYPLNTFRNVNGPHTTVGQDPGYSFYNALIPYGANGIANEDSGLASWISNNVKNDVEKPGGLSYRTRFYAPKVNNQCNIQSAGDFYNSDFNNWFNLNGSPTLADVPTVSNAVTKYGNQGTYTSGNAPKFPLYVYKGTKDVVSVVGDTNQWFKDVCGKGASVKYDQISGASHSDAQSQGVTNAWNFLSALLATPASSLPACSPAPSSL